MIRPQKKILVIDDDRETRKSVKLALEEIQLLDIHVSESVDATNGLRQMKNVLPDVIILDLHLPGKSGFEFMDSMRDDKRFDSTEVIMLTGDDRLDNVFTAEHKGIDVYYFLGKPFNVSDLQAVILQICLPMKHS
ncbi:MAG: response regulator [Candidatus Saccharimonadales bacterium]